MKSKKAAIQRELTQRARRDQLVAEARRLARQHLGSDGVTSVGVGWKEKKGKRLKTIAVVFGVDRKISKAGLTTQHRTPLPTVVRVDGSEIPTDVVEEDFELHYLLQDEEIESVRKRRNDPIRPGCSVANRSGSAGTVGAIVFDRTTGQPLILSNWHVLDRGNSNGGVFQPGPHDQTPGTQTFVGKMLRSHRGLAGDCAVSTIEARAWSGSILELDVVPTRIAQPEVGDTVTKSGRTTGVTSGIVVKVGMTKLLPYKDENIAIGGLFLIEPLSNANQLSDIGDSGALWLIRDSAAKPTDIAVGLHVAGSSRGRQQAMAGEITAILRKLDVSLTRP